LSASHDLLVSGQARFPARGQALGSRRIEFEFWGLKPQFSCSPGLISSDFEIQFPVRSRSPSRQNRKSQFWGLLPQNEPFPRHGLAKLSQVPNRE
jgi:hypothetical protein